MERRQISVLLEQAEIQARLGNHQGATALVQRALSLDPDHAVAHAVLADILLDARRLPGAGIEVRNALALDGHDPYIHRIAARVLTAERKLEDAWAHCLIALQSAATPDAFVLGAQIRDLLEDHAHARELLREALALDAAHTGALTQFAHLERRAGAYDEAARLAQLALETDPGYRPAHIAAGYIDLARGDIASAEQHAKFVLHGDSNDRAGLELWAAVQARRSRVLGVWWRWNTWACVGDDRRRLAILMAAYLVAQVAIIVSDELALTRLTALLSLGWLGFCVYTWFAPALFRRMIARSLESVRLDPDF
jgi:tetratricopeptide (TPR) repeat protein